MIRSFRGVRPRAAASAYIDPSAQVIGDVTLGERCSVWCHATLRGDVNRIVIGDESNIQDNCVVHVDEGDFPVLIGNGVTVGHSAVLHGCTVGDGALIGIGSIVLNGAKIGAGAVVAAGALVTEGMEVPPASLVMGTPAKVRRYLNEQEQLRHSQNAGHYVELCKAYLEESV